MFSFSTFISLSVAIVAIYIPLYFTFKKELEDLKTNSKDNKLKIENREEKLTTLKIICIILFVILVILYKLPLITSTLNNIRLPEFNDISDFFCKMIPFKKGFFSNSDFKFSYITGIVLSIITGLVWFGVMFETIEPDSFCEYIFIISILFILAFGLIWANNFISLFLIYCLKHCFEFLSIILNILSYVIICLIISIIMFFIFD